MMPSRQRTSDRPGFPLHGIRGSSHGFFGFSVVSEVSDVADPVSGMLTRRTLLTSNDADSAQRSRYPALLDEPRPLVEAFQRVLLGQARQWQQAAVGARGGKFPQQLLPGRTPEPRDRTRPPRLLPQRRDPPLELRDVREGPALRQPLVAEIQHPVLGTGPVPSHQHRRVRLVYRVWARTIE